MFLGQRDMKLVSGTVGKYVSVYMRMRVCEHTDCNANTPPHKYTT